MQLCGLEQVGILQRHVYAQVPPKVEYSLTELGRSIEPVLRQMCSWGEWYSEQMGLETQRLPFHAEAHLEKQPAPRTLTTRAE